MRPYAVGKVDLVQQGAQPECEGRNARRPASSRPSAAAQPIASASAARAGADGHQSSQDPAT